MSDQVNTFGTDTYWESYIRDFSRVQVYSTDPVSLVEFIAIDDYPTVPVHGHRGLLMAIENGHYGIVADILAAGGDANTHDRSGYTALHFASWTGHCRMIDLLLHYGAIIDAAPDDGLSPLALAVMRCRRTAAKLLLVRGAVVHAPEPVQTAVLCAAMWTHDLHVVRTLLHLGVNVDGHMSCLDTTALQVAVRMYREDLVQMLLDHGARVDTRSHPIEETPLAIAARWGQVTIFGLLVTARGTIDYASLSASGQDEQRELLRCALLGGKAEIFTMASDAAVGVDVNASYADGASPLMLAVECGHKDLVQLLLAHGGDPNVVSLPSSSLRYGSPLLAHGGDPNGVSSPFSPLRYGLRGLRSGHWHKGHWRPIHASALLLHKLGCVEILKLLLNHGADVNAPSEVGHTPLSLLAMAQKLWPQYREKTDEMERLLLMRGAVMDERSTMLLHEFYESYGISQSCDPPGA